MKAPDEQPPLPLEPPPEQPQTDPLAEARARRHLRLCLRPLAYCRPAAPDNDNGRRR